MGENSTTNSRKRLPRPAKAKPLEQWLSPDAAAALVSVSTETVLRAIRANELYALRTGKGGKASIRIPASALEEWRRVRWGIAPARPRRAR